MDLVYHSIDLTADTKPVYQTKQRYTQKEKEFAAKNLPEMEEAGNDIRAANDEDVRTQFPLEEIRKDQMP